MRTLQEEVNAGKALHEATMQVLSTLSEGDPPPDTPQGRALEELATAIEDYEKVMYPF